VWHITWHTKALASFAFHVKLTALTFHTPDRPTACSVTPCKTVLARRGGQRWRLRNEKKDVKRRDYWLVYLICLRRCLPSLPSWGWVPTASCRSLVRWNSRCSQIDWAAAEDARCLAVITRYVTFTTDHTRRYIAYYHSFSGSRRHVYLTR